MWQVRASRCQASGRWQRYTAVDAALLEFFAACVGYPTAHAGIFAVWCGLGSPLQQVVVGVKHWCGCGCQTVIVCHAMLGLKARGWGVKPLMTAQVLRRYPGMRRVPVAPGRRGKRAPVATRATEARVRIMWPHHLDCITHCHGRWHVLASLRTGSTCVKRSGTDALEPFSIRRRGINAVAQCQQRGVKQGEESDASKAVGTFGP